MVLRLYAGGSASKPFFLQVGTKGKGRSDPAPFFIGPARFRILNYRSAAVFPWFIASTGLARFRNCFETAFSESEPKFRFESQFPQTPPIVPNLPERPANQRVAFPVNLNRTLAYSGILTRAPTEGRCGWGAIVCRVAPFPYAHELSAHAVSFGVTSILVL